MEERSAAVSYEQRQKKLDNRSLTAASVTGVQQHQTWVNFSLNKKFNPKVLANQQTFIDADPVFKIVHNTI
jgi:hypothetical protein